MIDRYVFIGLIPGTGRRPSHYAVLDTEWRVLLQDTAPWRELPEIVARYPRSMCALGAPLAPGRQLLVRPEVRARVGLPPNSNTWHKFRVGEYQLRQRGIQIRSTPADAATAPARFRTIWALVAALREAGCVSYHPESQAPRQLLEVYPHASFTVLLGHLPFKRATLEGRLQRQLLLYDHGADVPDAMLVFEEITRNHLLRGHLDLRGLHNPLELDALVAALTARYAALHVDKITMVGDFDEGQIVLPAAHLKQKYLVA